MNTVSQRIGRIMCVVLFALPAYATSSFAQSFVDSEELRKVHLVYLEVRNEIGDECFASTRTLKSDVQSILRDRDIIVTAVRRFSTNILSLRVIGSLAGGTDVCTAALEIELYRWVRIGSGSAVRVKAYGALTLVTAERSAIFERLRENAAAFVTHLANDIQLARAQSE